MLTRIYKTSIFIVLLIFKFTTMKALELKKEIELLVKKLNEVNFVVFNLNELLDDNGNYLDEIYEQPYGYIVDKHQYHISCVVQKIENGIAYLLGMYEESGEQYECSVNELPIETIIKLGEMNNF